MGRGMTTSSVGPPARQRDHAKETRARRRRGGEVPSLIAIPPRQTSKAPAAPPCNPDESIVPADGHRSWGPLRPPLSAIPGPSRVQSVGTCVVGPSGARPNGMHTDRKWDPAAPERLPSGARAARAGRPNGTRERRASDARTAREGIASKEPAACPHERRHSTTRAAERATPEGEPSGAHEAPCAERLKSDGQRCRCM